MSLEAGNTEFERNVRAVLEESVARIDARTRSRLNRARHAALEAAAAPRRAWWAPARTLMPVTGAAAAALLVAVVLLVRSPSPHPEPPVAMEHPAAVSEDLELLADGEALDLVEEGGDGSGSFYEWAVTQSDANGESS